MIKAKVKVEDKTRDVVRAIDKAAFRNFGHAAASIRKDAIKSIKDAPRGTQGGSPPGTPPYTHGKGKRGRRIKKAILFAANKDGAVIGPAYSKFGTAGSAHEHGGAYKGQVFDKRPFMFPALKRQVSRLGNSWQGSIGQP